MPRRLSLLAVALVALAGACVGGGDPEPTDRPADGKPFVLVAGDSVLDEAADPLVYAIEASGDAHAAFFLGASLPHDDAQARLWRATIERYDPDLVVLQVGHWERLEVLGDFAERRRLEPGEYRDEIVDPVIDLLTEEGGRVLWVGPLLIRDQEESEFTRGLAEDFQAVAEDRDDVDYVEADPWVAPDGFVRRLPGPDGRPVQVRRADGIHLCPEGQLLVAAGMLDVFAADLGITPAADWQDAWRAQHPPEPNGCAESYHH
jgi:hypothetical protein